MTDIVRPGAGVVFMKVGTHADETLESIVERKRREIDEAGFALWGYGGNTCHPTTMVQPFAREFEMRGDTIHLVMQPMESNHYAVTARAEEMSADGLTWQPVPSPINVLGSRFALAIDELQPAQIELPLSRTRVAVGNSRGRRGDQYVRGRVDKAVLDVTGDEGLLDPESDDARLIQIGLTARLVEPYAYFVRN